MHTLRSRGLLLGTLALTMGVTCAAPPSLDGATQVLGDYPMCEASSAVWLGGDHLVVGDNEVRKTLFAFPLTDGRLDRHRSRALSLGKEVEISDIEALAGLESGEVVVFGSHSRNTRCRPRGNRRQFLRGRVMAGGFVASRDGVIQTSEPISCDRLFGDIAHDQPLLAAICVHVDAVEQAADAVWNSDASRTAKVAACNVAQPFNAEGALAVSDSSGEAIWIGLRSPLLPAASVGGSNDLAILLRMAGLDEYTFDEAAAVDLGGAGIRELTVSNGWVFGIAGSPGDSDVGFRLWMFPADELQAGATITPTFLESPRLPTSSEGLAIIDSTAHIIIDGNRDDDRCVEPSRYLDLHLPRELGGLAGSERGRDSPTQERGLSP